jgi:hypothetical protein
MAGIHDGVQGDTLALGHGMVRVLHYKLHGFWQVLGAHLNTSQIRSF